MTMKPEDLKNLLNGLRETDLQELSLESADTALYLRKSISPAIVAPEAISTVPQSISADESHSRNLVAIRSQMVGTFYSSDSKNHPPFVLNGNHVVPGQRVGVVGAMKVTKNVNSTVKGKI